MAAEAKHQVEILERGHIYFLYRPRVEEEEPEGVEDIQNLYMVLSPEDKARYRLAVIGRERLPKPERKGRGRFWGFIDAVEEDPRALREGLGEKRYQTKTRGERHQPAARPVGEGIYRILRHGDHTHLVYALELPEEPGEAQRELHIEEEASYILSIKNPNKPSPPRAGLSRSQEADYPEQLQKRFGDKRFADADPPELLDYPGAELLLISAASDVKQELGIDLKPEDEDETSADVFKDLRLRKSEQPTQPLFQGDWA